MQDAKIVAALGLVDGVVVASTDTTVSMVVDGAIVELDNPPMHRDKAIDYIVGQTKYNLKSLHDFLEERGFTCASTEWHLDGTYVVHGRFSTYDKSVSITVHITDDAVASLLSDGAQDRIEANILQHVRMPILCKGIPNRHALPDFCVSQGWAEEGDDIWYLDAWQWERVLEEPQFCDIDFTEVYRDIIHDTVLSWHEWQSIVDEAGGTMYAVFNDYVCTIEDETQTLDWHCDIKFPINDWMY